MPLLLISFPLQRYSYFNYITPFYFKYFKHKYAVFNSQRLELIWHGYREIRTMEEAKKRKKRSSSHLKYRLDGVKLGQRDQRCSYFAKSISTIRHIQIGLTTPDFTQLWLFMNVFIFLKGGLLRSLVPS